MGGKRRKGKGQRTKDQGPRTKDQGPRTKDQGPRTKDQGPRTSISGMFYETTLSVTRARGGDRDRPRRLRLTDRPDRRADSPARSAVGRGDHGCDSRSDCGWPDGPPRTRRHTRDARSRRRRACSSRRRRGSPAAWRARCSTTGRMARSPKRASTCSARTVASTRALGTGDPPVRHVILSRATEIAVADPRVAQALKRRGVPLDRVTFLGGLREGGTLPQRGTARLVTVSPYVWDEVGDAAILPGFSVHVDLTAGVVDDHRGCADPGRARSISARDRARPRHRR